MPSGQLHPAIVPSFVVVGGGNFGPTNELSLDSWFVHSFLMRLVTLMI